MTASLGLLAIAIVHVVGIYAAGFALKNPSMQWLPGSAHYEDISASNAPIGGYNFDTSVQGQATPRVPINVSARDEVKQQSPCIDCDLPPGSYVVPGSIRVVSNPTLKPGVQRPSGVSPTAPTIAPANNVVTKPPTQVKNHLALFVDGSAFSREVRSWFESDSNLRTVRDRVYFQEYTANNALYRSRYASTIPPERFPAIILMRPDGGHIYVASGPMLPESPDKLYSDMQAAYRLLEQVTKQSPAVRPDTPLLAGQLSEDVQLIANPEDCSDGTCNDRNRVLPPLFPANKPEDNPFEFFSLKRTNWIESTAMLIAVSVAGLLLYKRFSS